MLSDLPYDVLEHHILAVLPVHSIVACCLVEKHLQKYSSRLLAQFRTRVHQLPQQQRKLLESLFITGVSIAFLEWYEKTLRYPVFSSELVSGQLAVAAKGAKC